MGLIGFPAQDLLFRCYLAGLRGARCCPATHGSLLPTWTLRAFGAQMIKDQMDKKFGAPWHVVVGKGFSYEITYEVGTRGTQPRTAVQDRPSPLQGSGSLPNAHASSPPFFYLHESSHGPLILCVCFPTRPQVRNILFIYVGGKTAVLLWKM